MTPRHITGRAGRPGEGKRFDRLRYVPGSLVEVPRSPSAQAGTVPATLPASLYLRSRVSPLLSAQPAAQILRVAGRASFVFTAAIPRTICRQ